MLSFRYVEEKTERGTIFRPKIPITLINGINKVDVVALLDSGSDTIVLPKFIAELLQLELSERNETIDGIGGKIEVKNSNVSIVVQDEHERCLLIRIQVKIPLTETNWNEPLIGRIPFFQEFNIEFMENSKRVHLKRTQRH